jgi:AcrR family transcriptional regulator
MIRRTAPRQARSQRTEQRLLDAAHALLQERDYRAVTVEDVAARAHVSVGAFYKRFGSKQALLPALLQRMHAEQSANLDAWLADPSWRGRSLADRVECLIATLAAGYRHNLRLTRAFVALRNATAQTLAAAQSEYAEAVLQRLTRWLMQCRAEIAHDEPELALRVGLFSTVSALQSAIVQGRLETENASGALQRELARALVVYLSHKASGRG